MCAVEDWRVGDAGSGQAHRSAASGALDEQHSPPLSAKGEVREFKRKEPGLSAGLLPFGASSNGGLLALADLLLQLTECCSWIPAFQSLFGNTGEAHDVTS